MEAGQRAEALKHADAALALDPAFLAAQTLRERVVAMSGASVGAAMPAPAVAAAEAPPVRSFAVKPLPPADPGPSRRQGPDLAQFESRARQRRLERRVAAAQQGLAAGTLVDARAAINEIQELDPAHPALLSLVEALDAAERDRIVTFVERELPMRPIDEGPDLPFVAPVTSDLPLIATAVTPGPVPGPASDVSTEAVVVPAVKVPPSRVAPEIQTSTDPGVVGIRPVERAIRPTDVAPPRRRRSRVLPWLAAAAAFAGVVFAAPWLQRFVPSDVVSTPPPVEVAVIAPAVVPTTGADAAPIELTPLLDPSPSPDGGAGPDASRTVTPLPSPAVTSVAANEPAVSSTVAPIGTMPADNPVVASAATAPRPLPVAPTPAPADTVASVLPPVAPPAAPPQPRAESSPSFGISPDIPRQLADAPIPAPPAAPAARPPASAAANVPARPDDLQQVRAVLQQYRAAYQELSAERARAIWPDVNEPALQRAFQALESQTLTFEGCDVQLRGSTATATCRGTTQYVPKFGSREPRLEPRVWNFTLQKTGEAWQIASARTQR
jgi:hypothetical protein